MANSFPGSGLAYADAFSVGTANAAASSLYVASSCTQAVRIEHNFNQTNLHHNTLWLRATNSGPNLAASIGFTVLNNGGDHHRANIAATANSGQIGGNLALYTRNNNGNDQLGYFQDHAGNVGIGTSDFTNVAFGSPSVHVVGSRATLGLTSSGGLATLAFIAGSCPQTGLHINHSNDGKTAFYSYTSGGEVLTLLGNGRLGIGSTDPLARIHVEQTTSGEVGRFRANVAGCADLVLVNNVQTWGFRVDNAASNALHIRNFQNNTNILTATTGGNVGIGTTSPNRRLTISRPSESTTPQIEVRVEGGISDGNFDGISFTQGSAGATPLGSIRLKNSTDGYPGFGIYTRNSSTTESEKFTLTNSGSVGIGTSSPSSRLDVSGADGRIQSRVDNSDGSTINVRPNAGKCGWISYTEDAVADRWGVGIKNGDGALYFASGNVGAGGGTTRMVLTSTGAIGLGTASPASRFHITHTGAEGACTIILQSTNSCGNGTISWRTSAGVTQAQIGSNYNVGDNGGNLELITAGNTRLLVTSGGNLGVSTTSPSYRLHVNGTFYAAGSSVEYKDQIYNYDTDSCLFMCLKPVTYQYKNEWKHLGKELKSETQIGLIAEHVAEVMPELAILIDEDNNKVVRNVDYEKLSIVLLSEVQKLRREVDNLKNR